MRRTNFLRCEQSRLNLETKFSKVSNNARGASDFVIPRREHSADIFDEDEAYTRLNDDAPCWGPEISLVNAPALLSRNAMWLTRDATNEPIHASTPASAVEGSDIAPDRRRSQESRFHR
ncbi:hypothetical protein [Rhizobium sp. AB2/73]|uniref:hypothetical protein n=1 Tax=Rhizobium sp. AB2/73 TaxID=2795216 RepID=UPI001E5A0AF3|nr:hypothetical protein [Rhizobium sp. AB2/73]